MKQAIEDRPCDLCLLVLRDSTGEIIGCSRKGACLKRICADCGLELGYHEWLELRCTLENEDVTRAYCLPCFVERLKKWLTAVNGRNFHPHKVVSLQKGSDL